jgi:hypothetical protein
MEPFWNVHIELFYPFDTEAEARAAVEDFDQIERFMFLCHEVFGACSEVMTVRVEEGPDDADLCLDEY